MERTEQNTTETEIDAGDADVEESPAQEADKRYWHMGFYGGMEIELAPWRNHLTFTHEYPLTKKSLIADMLIIKKPPDIVIKNEIGNYFQGHNLVEFKSASDYLSVDAFYRALSYAYLYKSQGTKSNKISLSDVTLTILCFHYPKALFSELNAEGITTVEKSAGVYRLDGYHSLRVYVVVIPRLPHGTHLTLRLLRPNADYGEYVQFLDEASSLDNAEERNIESFVHIVMKGNPQFVKCLEKEMPMEWMDDATLNASIRRIFADLFAQEAEKVRKETAEQVERETVKRIERETTEKNQSDLVARMLQNHAPINLIEAYSLAPVERIMEIARSIGVTPVT